MPLKSRSKSRGTTRKTMGRKGKTMKVTSTVRVKKAAPRTRATILDVVNGLLNRKTETKYIGNWITQGALAAPGVAGTPQWENATQQLGFTAGAAQYWSVAFPAQSQGVTDQTRIGDRIEPKAHSLRMTVRLARTVTNSSESPSSLEAPTYSAQQTPLDITVYIFYGYVKSMKTYQGTNGVGYIGSSTVVNGQNEAARAMLNLLDDGDGTFSLFDGSQENAQLPLSDYVNMKVKKVRLRQAAGWINSAAGLASGTALANSDSQNQIMKQLTLKFKPPATLRYGKSTDIYPENYAPVYAVGYVYNDATASQPPHNVPFYGAGQVEYIAQSQLWFKDHQ